MIHRRCTVDRCDKRASEASMKEVLFMTNLGIQFLGLTSRLTMLVDNARYIVTGVQMTPFISVSIAGTMNAHHQENSQLVALRKAEQVRNLVKGNRPQLRSLIASVCQRKGRSNICIDFGGVRHGCRNVGGSNPNLARKRVFVICQKVAHALLACCSHLGLVLYG